MANIINGVNTPTPEMETPTTASATNESASEAMVVEPTPETSEVVTSGYMDTDPIEESMEDKNEAEDETSEEISVTVSGKPTPSKKAFGILSEEEIAEVAYQADLRDFEGLKTMPYIELVSRRGEAIKSIEDLKSMKAMMDQIGDISSEQYAEMVGRMDAAEHSKYEGDVKDFYARYDGMMDEATRIKALLDAVLNAFDHKAVSSTTFISKSMVESATLRKAAMLAAVPEDRAPNHNMAIKRIDEVLKAYTDRTDMSLIIHKLRYPNNVLEIYKDFAKNGPDEAMKYINKIFGPVFNDPNMTKFRTGFSKICVLPKDDNKTNIDNINVLVFFLTFWLAKMYEREYQSGKCAWIKVFIMNIYDLDPSSNLYDLPGGQNWIASAGYTIFMIISFIRSGTLPEKRLYKAVNSMIDEMVLLLEAEIDACRDEFPGANLTLGTSLVEQCGDSITLDEIRFVPEPEEDETDPEPNESDDTEDDESEDDPVPNEDDDDPEVCPHCGQDMPDDEPKEELNDAQPEIESEDVSTNSDETAEGTTEASEPEYDEVGSTEDAEVDENGSNAVVEEAPVTDMAESTSVEPASVVVSAPVKRSIAN